MKKIIFSLFIFSVIVFNINAKTYKIEDFVSSDKIEELKKSGRVSIPHGNDDEKLVALPNTKFSEIITNSMIPNGEISVLTEDLYYLKKSDFGKEITIQDLEIMARSLSKMQGMRYHFSEKYPNGKEVLYKKCYNIKDPSSKEPIPDVMEGDVAYCYQDDNTYGDTRYQINYYRDEGIFYCTYLNKRAMGFLGLDAVKEDNLRINIMFMDCGDSYLLYISCDVTAKKFPFVNVRKQINESMADRMEAIYKWFLLQLK